VRAYDTLAIWPFLTQDPIGLAGGVNLYAYAGNNPVSYDDPFGLCQKDDADCHKVAGELHAQKGKEFQSAAARYDAYQGRVHLVPHADKHIDADKLNGDGDPETWHGGTTSSDNKDVYINKDFDKGDRLITEVHESYHFGEGKDDQEIGTHEGIAYTQLSPADQATAPRSADRFYHWWGWPKGAHPSKAKEGRYPTNEEF
jgi:hypothetical protein